MQHFFVKENLDKDKMEIKDPEILQQMRKVLRFRDGDECVLLDGKGMKVTGMVEGNFFIVERREKFEENNSKVRLYAALSKKPETFEIILQKATELGVDEIIPLICERCQIDHIRKKERLEKIMKEAAEQSERVFLPTLAEALSFGDLLENLPDGELLAGDARDYDKKLSEIDFKDKNVSLVIGPEGGLTGDEIDMLRKKGATIFSMNKNVLRMETAAIASLAILFSAR